MCCAYALLLKSNSFPETLFEFDGAVLQVIQKTSTYRYLNKPILWLVMIGY